MTSNLSKVATPAEPADISRPDGLEDLNMNKVSVRVSVSSKNERLMETGQGPSLTQPTHFSLAPGIAPQVLSSATSELLKTPKDVQEDVETNVCVSETILSATKELRSVVHEQPDYILGV